MKILSLIAAFLLPIGVFAQIEITEIMYDLDGADADREWVEIHNTGSEPIDLTDWRFNDGSNHILYSPPHPEKGGQGSIVIPGGDFAILAQKPPVFLSGYSGFSETVIPVSMSLKNATATLSLVDSLGAVADSVSYDSAMGANDDGNSLQKNNSMWGAAAPTPGASFDSQSGSSQNGTTTDTSTGSNQSSEGEGSSSATSGSGGTIPLVEHVKAYIKSREATIGVGVHAKFEGVAFGLKDEPLANARYVWNFGDGTVAEGENVLHTYSYPGNYIVVLTASSGQYSGSDRMTVVVVPTDIVVSRIGTPADFYVTLQNKSSHQINLGGWILISGGSNFQIPEHTFIEKGGTLTLAPNATKLNYSEEVSLRYPDGTFASVFKIEPAKVAESVPEVGGLKTNSQEASRIVLDEGNLGNLHESDVSQTASLDNINVAFEPTSPFFSFWLLALFGMVFSSVFGFLFMRRYPREPAQIEEILAEEMEIIEEKGDGDEETKFVKKR